AAGRFARSVRRARGRCRVLWGSLRRSLWQEQKRMKRVIGRNTAECRKRNLLFSNKKMSRSTTIELKPAPPIEKIKVKVDGREIEVPRTMADPVSGEGLPTTMTHACARAK